MGAELERGKSTSHRRVTRSLRKLVRSFCYFSGRLPPAPDPWRRANLITALLAANEILPKARGVARPPPGRRVVSCRRFVPPAFPIVTPATTVTPAPIVPHSAYRCLALAAFVLALGASSRPAAVAAQNLSPRFGLGFNTLLSTADGLGLGFRGRASAPVNADLSLAVDLGLTGFVLKGRDEATYVFDPQVSAIVTLPASRDRAPYILGGLGAYVAFGENDTDGGPTIHGGIGWIQSLRETTIFYEVDPALIVGILGGAAGMTGAALLAGRAALKLGAGRIYIGSLEEDSSFGVDPANPELMIRHADDALGLDLDAMVVGPGLGESDRAETVLGAALASEIPCVLDADAQRRHPYWISM